MKVVCAGDSCTYGQNVRAEEAWPAVLAKATGWDVRNEGVCGDTTRLGLERFPKAVQLHHPDWVIVQYGHNDANTWQTDFGEPRVALGAYAANIEEMRLRARACGAKTLVLTPHHAPGRDRAYNDRLAAYVLAAGGVSVRGTSVLKDGYGVHPDVPMHRRYARLVMDHIR